MAERRVGQDARTRADEAGDGDGAAPRARHGIPPLPVFRPLYRRPAVAATAAIVAAILVALGVLYWLHTRGWESTDDAFIDGHVVAISPRVSGHVARVAVDDNRSVRAGDVLVELDPRDFQVALAEARAQAAAIAADAARAAGDARRAEALFRRALMSRQDLDRAVASARALAAQLDAAQKKVTEAELALSYTLVRAPEAGRVTRKAVEPGAFVPAGQTLLVLVPPDVWVTANFKETQLTRMRPGQSATVKVDAYPGHVFRGHVDSIQSGTGARFSLLPPENATGNFVKVVQRVPVKIAFDSPPDDTFALGPGMSVIAGVRVR